VLLLRSDSRERPSFVPFSFLLSISPGIHFVPYLVFWEEGGPQPFALKITITRPPEASLPAFLRHFEDLLDIYSSVHIINLLSSRDQEAALTEAYEAHLIAAAQVDETIRDNVSITEFDFHARSRIGGIESVKTQLATAVGQIEEQFGACFVAVDREGEATVVMGQRGVFRTNCKGGSSSILREPTPSSIIVLHLADCLDRTNVVEDVLSRFALEDFIRNTNPSWQSSDLTLWSSHRVLFAENGDALSKIYVGTGMQRARFLLSSYADEGLGTGAINTSFTRSGKKSFAGLLSDATKSVGRMYQQQFNDGSKQKAIDALLVRPSRSPPPSPTAPLLTTLVDSG
jgi:hypothetical protein